MSKRHYVLIALLLALVTSATIQPAIAYFTTFVNAKGGYEISVGDTTTIEEEFDDWTKTVVICNKEGSEPVFIRAKVIYTGLDGNEKFTVSGQGWTMQPDSKGYYYYGTANADGALTILEAKDKSDSSKTGKTSPLTIKIDEIPQNPKENSSFSVTVIYESTPVRYKQDADGNNVAYANWDAKIERVAGGNS